MRLARTVLVIVAGLWPLAAGATEVKLGGGVDAVYDSNVFRTNEDQKSDASFRFTPTLDISEQTDKLEASLYYAPTYEAFTTYTDANAFSHYLNSDIAYQAGPQTKLELNNVFRVMYVLNYGDPDTIDEGTTPVPDNNIERDQMYLYDSALEVTHAITPRWTSKSDVAFDLFDPHQRRNTVGSKSVSAFQNFTYAYDRSNLFGVGGGAVVQMYDEVNTLPGSNTYIFRLFGTYERHFGESTTLTVRAGPAFILTRQDSASNQREDTFPFIKVKKDTTVGDLIANNIPIDKVAFGQSLNNSTPVAAGSVVVPSPFTCIDARVGPTGTAIFKGSKCNLVLLLRSDMPGELEAAGVVLNEKSNVVIQGSNAGSEDSSFSIFGDITLEHYWTPNLISTLSYNRSQSDATGVGAGSIADSASFITVWRPSPLWDLSIRGSYIKRKSPTDLSRTYIEVIRDPDMASPTFGLVRSNGRSLVIEDSSSVDTEQWQIAARVARRLTRHISIAAWASYNDQTSAHTGRNPNDFGDFTAILGFKYDFDPFRF